MEPDQPPLEWPSQVGVMALPGATLFPSSLLPLYIFEPRFRLMLARALATHRCFAVANADADADADASSHAHTDLPRAIGGLGLIRACVQNPDGTSHLILQGISRVRFASWPQRNPYLIGEISLLTSPAVPTEPSRVLMEHIREMCRHLQIEGMDLPQQLDASLGEITDPQVFSDLVSATLILEPSRRQELLEEIDPLARLQMLSDFLSNEVA